MTDTTLAARPTVLGWFEPGTDDWHAARAAGIGGSEIAAVMGISPYESRFSLWHRKQGLIAPVEESEEMYWGKVHEPAICERFDSLHPDMLVAYSPTYAASDRPWQIANPDRLIVTDYVTGTPTAIVEAKTARDDHGWGKAGTDEIPVHYRAQCLWYLDVLQVTRCHVAVLIAGSEYREYVIEYDQAEADLMVAAGAEFMQSLAAGDRPDIDGHSATFQTIKALPEGQDDTETEVSTADRDRYFAALDAAKAAETEKRAAAGALLDQIGTGRRAVHDRKTVATRTVRDGRTYSLQPARNRSTA
ncbi:YqaJ viral recombinase family nuclease [Streptomyces griseolus]|uniref:YqaJ viral recombinase family nuclease n=1 Tax=Streptomyces griseolus TaxID=1909 RepID=UPI002242CD25|nr:YqaJ viral recombinase family protein [Streptomyces griseolus]MCW8219441.1 YqaJ viral recombinase family protein [Streptomyces griseolus]